MTSNTSVLIQTVIEEINQNSSTDLLDLRKCEDIYNNLLAKRNAVFNEINPSNSIGFVGSSINASKDLIIESENALKCARQLTEKAETDLEELLEVRLQLKEKLDSYLKLETTLQYLKVVQRVEQFCNQLQHVLDQNDYEKCTTFFANLTEIDRLLADCPVNHLKTYVKETVMDWFNILKEKLTKYFDDVLKEIQWPFVKKDLSSLVTPDTCIPKLQLVVEYLLQIEMLNEANIVPEIPSGILSHFSPPCLPIRHLLLPLRKRFIYHFYGSRKTNRADKPEWYFTQVLTWIRDHQEYVENWIQPIIDKFGLHHVNAKIEFMAGLVYLAAEKLNGDLPSFEFDDYTFSHAIDEALGFDKELCEVYNYPVDEPRIIIILTQASVLKKWLIMEKKYATEKMDGILSTNSNEPFELVADDIEDLKITTCADAFITLLKTITERYEGLPQPGHRLQFLELQLELLDDFRIRLLQIAKDVEGDVIESKIPSIINTLFYVENVLNDWGVMLHYLNLHYYKNQLENNFCTNGGDEYDVPSQTISDSIFSKTTLLYSHLRISLLDTLTEDIFYEIKRQSTNYRRENWFSMKTEKDVKSLIVSQSACQIFDVLIKKLLKLETKLHKSLFSLVWRSIATQVDSYFFEHLILDNRFSEGGALQLKFDITRNLLPLFSQYTNNMSNYFPQLIESCILLNLSKGSALLLRDTLIALEGATGVEDTRQKMLNEIGLVNFGSNTAIKVLNQRTDITVNRLLID